MLIKLKQKDCPEIIIFTNAIGHFVIDTLDYYVTQKGLHAITTKPYVLFRKLISSET